MISIIILVHNAPMYAKHTLETLRKASFGEEYEVIVLDNKSNFKTRKMLLDMHEKEFIDKMIFMNENTLFAKGNNLAVKLCNVKSKYILLLNSDVEIKNKKWLKELRNLHERGATAFGFCENPPRGDGFCFFIDKDLYEKYKLDEEFEWWWSITRLQAELLSAGYTVTAVLDHDNFLYHYGGKSGKSWKSAKGMNISSMVVENWFGNNKIKKIEKIQEDKNENTNARHLLFNIRHKIKCLRKKK